METPAQRDKVIGSQCADAAPAAGTNRNFPPSGFVDQSGAAALFGISSSQLSEWIRQGRLGCRGELINGPNGARRRVWPIEELERARRAMANPDGWVSGDVAAAIFGLTMHVWRKWVQSKRAPQGRWGHRITGKRCLLFQLDELKKLKAQLEEEEAQSRQILEPYPDPERPSVYRLPVASGKHTGMEDLSRGALSLAASNSDPARL